MATKKDTDKAEAPSSFTFAKEQTVRGPDGVEHTFAAGDPVPDWAAARIRGDAPTPAPAVDENDLRVPGPGQSFVFEDPIAEK